MLFFFRVPFVFENQHRSRNQCPNINFNPTASNSLADTVSWPCPCPRRRWIGTAHRGVEQLWGPDMIARHDLSPFWWKRHSVEPLAYCLGVLAIGVSSCFGPRTQYLFDSKDLVLEMRLMWYDHLILIWDTYGLIIIHDFSDMFLWHLVASHAPKLRRWRQWSRASFIWASPTFTEATKPTSSMKSWAPMKQHGSRNGGFIWILYYFIYFTSMYDAMEFDWTTWIKNMYCTVLY